MRRRRAVCRWSEPVSALETRLCLSASSLAAVAQLTTHENAARHVKSHDKVKPQATDTSALEGQWNWQWDGGGDGTFTLTPDGNKLQVNFSRPTLIMGSGPVKVHGNKVKMKIAGTQAYPFKAKLTMTLSDADHMAGKFDLTYTEKVSREDSFSIGISAVHV